MHSYVYEAEMHLRYTGLPGVQGSFLLIAIGPDSGQRMAVGICMYDVIIETAYNQVKRMDADSKRIHKDLGSETTQIPEDLPEILL